MQLYDQHIDAALQYLLRPQIMNPMGDKPIAFVTYKPEDAIEIHQKIDGYIKPKAKYYGFTSVHVINVGDVIDSALKESQNYLIFTTDNLYKHEDKLFKDVACEVQNLQYVSKAILQKQEELKDEELPLIVIDELELLHPLDRIGNFEAKHYNDIFKPILVLYPGTTSGIARSFLDVFDMDGSYRSKNF